MSIDETMRSLDAIGLIIFAAFIGLSIILLFPDLIESYIRDRRKKKQQALEQQDRLARPEHWAAIDAERATTREARRQHDIAYKQRQIDTLNDTIARRQAQLDKLHSTSVTETITQAKQRLRAVQARYANAHLQQGDEKHYIIDAPNIFDVTVPETAAYLEAVAHAEQLLDSSTNDAATADTAMTEAVTAVENAWNTMVSAALQAEQPWPVVIEKTSLEDTDIIRVMQQQRHQQHTEVDAALTRADNAAQSIQQAVTRDFTNTDQQRQTPPQQ